MKELMAVESALFSAGRALDATEVAEATGLSRNKAISALDSIEVLCYNWCSHRNGLILRITSKNIAS